MSLKNINWIFQVVAAGERDKKTGQFSNKLCISGNQRNFLLDDTDIILTCLREKENVYSLLQV